MTIFTYAILADASCVELLCGRQTLFGAMAGLRLGRFIPMDRGVRGVFSSRTLPALRFIKTYNYENEVYHTAKTFYPQPTGRGHNYW